MVAFDMNMTGIEPPSPEKNVQQTRGPKRTENPEKLRQRAARAFRDYFEKRSSPRSMLSVIILITALTGFGISTGLLAAGVTAMWMRYPAAAMGAYGIFLGLIRLWVEIERRQFDPDDPGLKKSMEDASEPYKPPVFKSDSKWSDYLDIPTIGDAGEVPIFVLLGVLVALGVAVFAIISSAPILIAEVFVDAFLAGLLYRRLRIAASEAWLGTAISKTLVYALWTVVLLFTAGLCLDLVAPNSNTMGMAIKEIVGW